jgi:branched-chain amino acid transport system ATP-binding protein
MAALLSVDGISRTFGGIAAVSDVSYEVAEGSLTGLVGPNGSGKTTLINVITRLIPPTGGRLFFGGRDYTRMRSFRVADLGIARTFQNIRLVPSLSVLENVQLGFHHRGREATLLATWLQLPAHRRVERESRAQAGALLERLGVGQTARMFPSELPYGLQRRVEIARALASAPRLLVLDEPVAGMAWPEAVEIANLLKEVRATGVTVLIVEHNVRLLGSICDQMAALSSGRLLASGPPASVLRNEEVVAAYLGRGARADSELA